MVTVKVKKPGASNCCSTAKKNTDAKSSCCSTGANTKDTCCNSDTKATDSCCSGTEGEDSCCSGSTEATTDKVDKICSCQVSLIHNEEQTAPEWATGSISTPAGPVFRVATHLTFSDTLGSWKARWGIGRMDYSINPGIYCVGEPDSNSPVLVTANYKMSFDSLRRELDGISAWVLVLDTKGINVWCAAGKGTFGTDELVNRIKTVNLSSIVSHRTVILPQLGAPGVAAHEVTKKSGFKVIYGPVRASDVKAFLNNGMKADPKMRTVEFTIYDRLVLTPNELVTALKPLTILLGILFIINAMGLGNFGFTTLYSLVGAILAGAVLTPVLLPWIPGRALAFKGWLMGILWTLAVILINNWSAAYITGLLPILTSFLLLPALSAFLAMNFTGCTTYTSYSGVKREMQIAVPLMFISAVLGIVALAVQGVIMLIS